jgi:hypothetical protein
VRQRRALDARWLATRSRRSTPACAHAVASTCEKTQSNTPHTRTCKHTSCTCCITDACHRSLLLEAAFDGDSSGVGTRSTSMNRSSISAITCVRDRQSQHTRTPTRNALAAAAAVAMTSSCHACVRATLRRRHQHAPAPPQPARHVIISRTHSRTHTCSNVVTRSGTASRSASAGGATAIAAPASDSTSRCHAISTYTQCAHIALTNASR